MCESMLSGLVKPICQRKSRSNFLNVLSSTPSNIFWLLIGGYGGALLSGLLPPCESHKPASPLTTTDNNNNNIDQHDEDNISHFYQRVSTASYASAGIAREGMSVCLSVRLSVTHRYCIKTKKASVMISSPSDSLNILVSRNVWFITKFDRGHNERGRFLRLGWVRTGDFGDFSTNKPPYLRNGARYRTKVAIDH